ncbi:MAG: beta-galactosidase [Planctomycetota bacterium]|nr:beta-galactosidase [Planctomycetota bacterium]
MASVTYDGRSFMVDGRRIWLMSGTVAYSRVPKDQWLDRIHAAKLAGLNAIDTPVFWNRHEPRPGRFDFSGDADIRHFVQLVGKAGMYLILRLGPYTGRGWDMGGLPPWLLEAKQVALRTNNSAYLEACSRFINAVAEQIRDLQIAAAGAGGPILLIQLESGWTCGHDELATAYLGELMRYLRESGLMVHVVNDTNLWQSAEGQIDCWRGSAHMFSTMRQLATVRSDQPRLVIDFDAAGTPLDVWGREALRPLSPASVQRRVAEALAAGAQVNFSPFAGGTNFGFWGGRLGGGHDQFVASGADQHAPIGETGVPSRSYNAIRRISTFATRFGRVLASLDPVYQPVALDPSPVLASTPAAGKAKSSPAGGVDRARGQAVIHTSGTQGGVVFVFGRDPEGENVGEEEQTVSLLMPDGSPLNVHLGSQAVAWMLMECNLSARARLDYSTFNALAMIGKVFVCYGPAGKRGVVSINGSPLDVEAPAAGVRKPTIEEHEGVFVVALSEELVDQTFLTDAAVFVGVAGLTPEAKPIVAPGVKQFIRVDTNEGGVKVVTVGAASAVALHEEKAPAATLGPWSIASADEYTRGESARFARIPGPAELASLGCAFGYGWYRLDLPGSSAHKATVACVSGGDRLHMFVDGECLGIMGLGPGATSDIALPLKKGAQRLVVLADNLGRFSEGSQLGEPKGLTGHLWEVSRAKLPPPKVVRGEPIEVLSFRAPLWEVREGDLTASSRVTWTLARRKRGNVLMRLNRMSWRALLVVNDAPLAYVDQAGPAHLILTEEQLGRGNATVQLVLLADGSGAASQETEAHAAAAELGETVEFLDLDSAVTEQATWHFAKWEPPAAGAFEAAPKTVKATGPTWWSARFRAPASEHPLHVHLTGMTKGQIYINQRHLGRYFVATSKGTPVPPQESVFIPPSFLRHDSENEIMLFDEHGGQPAKIKFAYDAARTPLLARSEKK